MLADNRHTMPTTYMSAHIKNAWVHSGLERIMNVYNSPLSSTHTCTCTTIHCIASIWSGPSQKQRQKQKQKTKNKNNKIGELDPKSEYSYTPHISHAMHKKTTRSWIATVNRGSPTGANSAIRHAYPPADGKPWLTMIGHSSPAGAHTTHACTHKKVLNSRGNPREGRVWKKRWGGNTVYWYCACTTTWHRTCTRTMYIHTCIYGKTKFWSSQTVLVRIKMWHLQYRATLMLYPATFSIILIPCSWPAPATVKLYEKCIPVSTFQMPGTHLLWQCNTCEICSASTCTGSVPICYATVV